MKLRTPNTFAAAVTQVRDALGEHRCAEIVGRSASLVRKWADPDHESLPNLESALLLDAAFVTGAHGEPPILGVYAELLSRAVAEKPEDPPFDIITAALSVQSAVGDLSEAIMAARLPSSPGGVTIADNERNSLLALLEILDNQIRQVEEGLEDAGQP